jgi:cation:H+ antiporter
MDVPRTPPRISRVHVAEVGACDACLRSGRQRVNVALALGAALPGAYLGFALLAGLPHPEPAPPMAALVFGLAVVGAAFVLSWAAELAALEISAGLAISVLALVAVLPEYAVDFVFAWRGGNAVQADGTCQQDGEDPCSLALANMTGANRLLIGVGWALVVLVAWVRLRGQGRPRGGVRLPRSSAVEATFLALATLYSLTLPLKRTVTLVDLVVLVAIFVAYTLRIARAPPEAPNLVGPSAWLATLPARWRRATYLGFFAFAAVVILLSAEHFADGLVQTGQQLGISPFYLVQWLAPLASEAPELLVAGLYAWHLNTTSGLGALVSSKVNQWTLLVGTLPLVFTVASAGTGTGLPVGPGQREELLLTAAQSLFAIAVLVNLEISVREAAALSGLFLLQFALAALVPGGAELVILAAAYLAGAVVLLLRARRLLGPLLRDGLRTPTPSSRTSAAGRRGPAATDRRVGGREVPGRLAARPGGRARRSPAVRGQPAARSAAGSSRRPGGRPSSSLSSRTAARPARLAPMVLAEGP